MVRRKSESGWSRPVVKSEIVWRGAKEKTRGPIKCSERGVGREKTERTVAQRERITRVKKFQIHTHHTEVSCTQLSGGSRDNPLPR